MCTNCLRANHLKQECLSTGCKKCSKNHNTLLHIDSVVQTGNATAGSLEQEDATNDGASTSNYVNTGNAVVTVGRVCNHERSHILLSMY